MSNNEEAPLDDLALTAVRPDGTRLHDEPDIRLAELPEADDFKNVGKALETGGDLNPDLAKQKRENLTRAESAVTLRLSGASYTQIAKTLGYTNAQVARSAVERVLAAGHDNAEDKDKMRSLIDRRLNRLLQATMGKATDPKDPQNLAYSARALAIIDRQARLHGVDAPTQVQVTPTDERIQAMVQKMVEVSGKENQAIEADILDEGESI